jgi:LmbE family N-acetylglucosaminyl deacetylase
LYCLLTRGEAGSDGTPPEQSATIREAEERETARVVGVDTAEFLGLPDGVLEYGVPLRREITRVVRRHKPEIVITLNFAERWAGGGFNTADHIACGRATMDAVRDAGNRWIFPEQISDEAWRSGTASVRCGSTVPPTTGARSTSPTPSSPGSSRLRRTGSTSTASAGRRSTPPNPSRAWPGRPGAGWASR